MVMIRGFGVVTPFTIYRRKQEDLVGISTYLTTVV